jgi:hypothetical protein
MLFDLRSRGRRTTVRGVYLFLAVLMGGGLILFGVGTGTGGGGLLNAFSNSGSSNNGAVVSAAEKTALKAVKANPNSPAAWASLVTARYEAAGQGGNFNSSTGTLTAAGRKEMTGATTAWQHYLSLTGGKDPSDIALTAARAYGVLGDYAGEASTYQVVTATNPTEVKGFECLAASAYAAKEDRVGDLALNKALSMVAKSTRALLKTQIQAAKTQPSIAATC